MTRGMATIRDKMGHLVFRREISVSSLRTEVRLIPNCRSISDLVSAFLAIVIPSLCILFSAPLNRSFPNDLDLERKGAAGRGLRPSAWGSGPDQKPSLEVALKRWIGAAF
jgi:hypothetical protein